jgi:hypothetical protein
MFDDFLSLIISAPKKASIFFLPCFVEMIGGRNSVGFRSVCVSSYFFLFKFFFLSSTLQSILNKAYLKLRKECGLLFANLKSYLVYQQFSDEQVGTYELDFFFSYFSFF